MRIGWTEESIGRLGNLLFLDSEMNEKLDTKPFETKMKLLESEGYTVPIFIEQCSSWTPNDVDEHTNNMAQTAYNEIWAL